MTSEHDVHLGKVSQKVDDLGEDVQEIKEQVIKINLYIAALERANAISAAIRIRFAILWATVLGCLAWIGSVIAENFELVYKAAAAAIQTILSGRPHA